MKMVMMIMIMVMMIMIMVMMGGKQQQHVDNNSVVSNKFNIFGAELNFEIELIEAKDGWMNE